MTQGFEEGRIGFVAYAVGRGGVDDFGAKVVGGGAECGGGGVGGDGEFDSMGVEADAEEGVYGLGAGGYLGEEGGVLLCHDGWLVG